MSWQLAWVTTNQLPTNLGWIQQLIAKTSLDFTLFTTADAFAALFGTVCAILVPGTEADSDNSS